MRRRRTKTHTVRFKIVATASDQMANINVIVKGAIYDPIWVYFDFVITIIY